MMFSNFRLAGGEATDQAASRICRGASSLAASQPNKHTRMKCMLDYHSIRDFSNIRFTCGILNAKLNKLDVNFCKLERISCVELEV